MTRRGKFGKARVRLLARCRSAVLGVFRRLRILDRLPGDWQALEPFVPATAHSWMGTLAITAGAMLASVEPLVARALIDVALTPASSMLFLVLLGLSGALAGTAFVLEGVGSLLVRACRESGAPWRATVFPARFAAVLAKLTCTAIFVLAIKPIAGATLIVGAVLLVYRRIAEPVARRGLLLAILLVGGFFVMGGGMTVGEYVCVSLFTVQVPHAVGLAARLWAKAKTATRAEPQKPSVVSAVESGAYTFRTSWGWPLEARHVHGGGLKDASFRIERGARLLFTGDARAANAVLGLLSGVSRPEQGAVCVGSAPIFEMPPAFARRWSARIFATPQIRSGSLRDNLSSELRPSDARLRRILAATGLDAFVAARGLDCTLGAGLTPSDRHRVQVARALLHDPRVLLVEDFAGEIETSCAMQLLRAINEYAETVVMAGAKDLFLEIAAQVIWVDQGVCRAPSPVAEFLGSREGVRLFPPRRVYGAIRWAA